MSKKFPIILADPPWSYNDKAKHQGGAEKHYRTMPLADICALPIKDIAADNAALFIWGTWPLLFEAENVINSWGFKYKTVAFVWVKTWKLAPVKQGALFADTAFDSGDASLGLGSWTRSNSEFCLLATRGKLKRIDAGVRQIIFAPNFRHSEKPPETRDRIVQLLGPLPRVELFARSSPPGWDTWGNQTNSTIKL